MVQLDHVRILIGKSLPLSQTLLTLLPFCVRFDIIADLLFGEPFGCLQNLSTHKYISLLLANLKMFRLSYVMYYWPFIRRLRSLLLDQQILRGRIDFYRWIGERTQQRVQTETQRPDFMTEILKHNGEKGAEMTPTEMNNNASIMITAGSETTATLLSGVTYCLLKNPEVMKKLKDEVRGKWKKYDDITLEEVNKAPYLIAVLQEALRYYPPLPTGFERRVGKGGEFVSGYFIPEDTAVCVSSSPTGRSPQNFKDPDSFIPERWTGDPRFVDDKKTSIQPFSVGPRNCLGKVRFSKLCPTSTPEKMLTCHPRTLRMPRCVSSLRRSHGRLILSSIPRARIGWSTRSLWCGRSRSLQCTLER